MMRRKRRCWDCRAVLNKGTAKPGCLLGYQNAARKVPEYEYKILIPLSPCPKPLTKVALSEAPDNLQVPESFDEWFELFRIQLAVRSGTGVLPDVPSQRFYESWVHGKTPRDRAEQELDDLSR